MGFGGMLRALPGGESTPPLYYVLAWLWTRATGTGEVGLRSLSAVAGTATIGLVYAAAQRLLGRRAAVAAAALTAFSPLLIWYSQEARSYALLVALCAASVWALAAALEGGSLAPWAGVCCLALATHYFAAFVIAPEALWLVRARRRAWPALGAIGLTAAALAPLALHQRAQGGADFISASPLTTRLAQAAKQLIVGYDAPGEVALTVAAAVLVAGLAWLAARHGGAPAARLAGVAAAAVGVPIALALVGLDYVITRNLIGCWVPFALALSAWGAVSGGRAGPALVAGLCVVGLVATLGIDLDARYQRDDWRGAAAQVPAGAGGVALVVTPGSGAIPLAYYLRQSRPLAVAGAPVSLVEVIGVGARGVGAPVDAPAVPAVPLGLAGFGPAAVARHATFSVLRYRAVGPPVLETPASLAGLALDRRAPAAILLARPR